MALRSDFIRAVFAAAAFVFPSSVATFVFPSSAAGGAPARMTFRNNLLLGHLTVHRVSRVIRRKAPRKQHVERLKYRQRARWVQCNLDEPKPGNVLVYQMMDDEPAKVLSVSHGRKKVRPTPPASDFNLPQGSTRLHSAYTAPRDGPVQVPLTEPVQRAVLQALLDFAHWPRQRVEAGARWQRDISGGGIRGTQTFEFVDLVEIKGDVVGRVTLYVEGQFEDPLSRDYLFGKGQAIIHWSRPERTLVKLEAQADYQRRRENAPEQFKLELEVGLRNIASLDEDGQDRVRDQMIAFEKALREHRAGRNGAAREICREFRSTWPDALWLPAVRELESRSVAKKAATERMSLTQLDVLLAKSVIVCEAARSNYEYDLLERTCRTLEKLSGQHLSKLIKLARSENPGRRARAVFALAFSRRPQDLDLVQKAARDKSPEVRAMALAGLAVRRHPGASVELLILMLDDEVPAIRRRACQAVAACLSPEHYSVVGAIEKLDRLMIHDQSSGVRREAVRALAAVGGPAEIAKLEKALTHELDVEIREEIHAAIDRLRAGNG
jgi:hypothetical protein